MKEEFTNIYEALIGREGHIKLLKYLEGAGFFEAPASTRFHLSEPGGLCLHSIHVFKRLKQLCEMEAASNPNFEKPTDETIAIVGLLHDVCKVGCYREEPRNQKTYDPEKVKAAQKYQVKHDALGDFIWESVMSYKFEDPLPFGHGEKSVYVISSFMKLTREEAFAIRFHMGHFSQVDERTVGKAFEMYPLAFLAHEADMMATYLDEVER